MPGPQILTNLRLLVNIWNSRRFRVLHAGEISNGLDYPSNLLLYVLGWHGPSQPSFLAEQMACGRANVSKVVNGLEEGGLVTRGPGGDARSVVVSLTAEGEREARAVFAAGRVMLEELTRDWSDEELVTFATLTGRFAAAAARYEQRLESKPESK